jgi:hypothetical protein
MMGNSRAGLSVSQRQTLHAAGLYGCQGATLIPAVPAFYLRGCHTGSQAGPAESSQNLAEQRLRTIRENARRADMDGSGTLSVQRLRRS